MPGFKSRGEKMLALVPKCNIQSENESSDSEDELVDEDHLTRRIDTMFQQLTEDFGVAFEGETLDHPSLTVVDTTNFDEEPMATEELLVLAECGSNGDTTILNNFDSPMDDIIVSNSPVPSGSSYSKKKSQPPKRPQKQAKRKRTAAKPKKKKAHKAEYHWERGVRFQHSVSLPPQKELVGNDHVLEPIHYFLLMFSPELVGHIVFQSNLYATQEKNAARMRGNVAIIDKHDIYDYLAIEILTGVVGFPSIDDPWSQELRYEKLASIMPVKKYKDIKRILHFNDNDQLPSEDPYFKVRPLVEIVLGNFASIPEEQKYSIDEMMIPYKGKRAGSRRQFMKDKPVRWGLKLFVRSGVSGMTYDFILYCGVSTFDTINFTEFEEQFGVSSKAVIALIKSIPQPALKFLFFDNFYSNPRLMTYLRNEYGILSLGTIRIDRFPGLKFKSDKDMKKQGRGAYESLVDNKKKLAAIKWMDNKGVHVVSSFCDAGTETEVQRWSKQEKLFLTVKCPEVISIYNEFMGGVDLSGQFVSFYRCGKKSRKWYMCIFYQILDMCINNAWLMYRRDFMNVRNQNPEELYGAKTHMALKPFRVLLANQLVNFERSNNRGRPVADERGNQKKGKNTPPNLKKRQQVKYTKDRNGRNKKAIGSKDSSHTLPKAVPPSIRFDAVGHFPIVGSKGRCRNCNTGQTSWMCSKCEVRVCLLTDRNCFYKYHQKAC